MAPAGIEIPVPRHPGQAAILELTAKPAAPGISAGGRGCRLDFLTFPSWQSASSPNRAITLERKANSPGSSRPPPSMALSAPAGAGPAKQMIQGELIATLQNLKILLRKGRLGYLALLSPSSSGSGNQSPLQATSRRSDQSFSPNHESSAYLFFTSKKPLSGNSPLKDRPQHAVSEKTGQAQADPGCLLPLHFPVRPHQSKRHQSSSTFGNRWMSGS